MLHREAQARRAADRLAQDSGLVDLQMIHEGHDVVGKVEAIGAALDIVRPAEAAQVQRYDLVPLREVADLLPPDRVVAAGAVQEDERWPATVDLVIEVDPVDLRNRHPRSLCAPPYTARSVS